MAVPAGPGHPRPVCDSGQGTTGAQGVGDRPRQRRTARVCDCALCRRLRGPRSRGAQPRLREAERALPARAGVASRTRLRGAPPCGGPRTPRLRAEGPLPDSASHSDAFQTAEVIKARLSGAPRLVPESGSPEHCRDGDSVQEGRCRDRRGFWVAAISQCWCPGMGTAEPPTTACLRVFTWRKCFDLSRTFCTIPTKAQTCSHLITRLMLGGGECSGHCRAATLGLRGSHLSV